MVNSAFFLVLRRMRAPIIVLIVIYGISVIGLTLVPGVDAEGRPAPPLDGRPVPLLRASLANGRQYLAARRGTLSPFASVPATVIVGSSFVPVTVTSTTWSTSL